MVIVMAGNRKAAVQRSSSIQFEQPGNSLHVWSAALDREPDDLQRLEANLSQEEKARANRFHFVRDRNHFVAARGILRKLLGRYLRRNPAEQVA